MFPGRGGTDAALPIFCKSSYMSDICNCCEDEVKRCPSGQWITIHRWIGSYSVPNDLRDIPGKNSEDKSVWEQLGLEKFEDSVWQWRIVVLGTGTIPDLTRLCLAQNRRDWSEWTAPLSDRPVSEFYKIEVTGLKYNDSILSGLLVGGTFSLLLSVGGISQPANFNFNDAATLVESTLQGLSNAANAGTITVTGSDLTAASLAVAFTAPIENIVLSAIDALVGSVPSIFVTTENDGGVSTGNEIQVVDYGWPATGGTFILSVTIGSTTQTTSPIAYDADGNDIRDALLALSLLSTTPNINTTTISPFTQLIEISGNATVIGGSFRLILTVNGATAITGNVSATASVANVRTVLKALPNVLPTDDFTITSSGILGIVFPFNVDFIGSFQFGPPIPPMVGVSSLIGGDVRVTSTTASSSLYDSAIHARHRIEFVGSLAFTNIPLMSASSNLTNKPIIRLTTPFAGNVNDFRNTFEPLNVGTLWKNWIRGAYGNVIAREIHETPHESTYNPGRILGPSVSQTIEEQACGDGIIAWQGCNPSSNIGEWGVKGQATIRHRTKAEFNSSTGTVNVQSDLPFEIGFQIRCLGCRYSSEFGQWGIFESSELNYQKVYDYRQPNLYDPGEGGYCENSGKDITIGFIGLNPSNLVDCRLWRIRENNIPYVDRKKFGPDGFDGHLINEIFYADGAKKARKPPCSPDVVMLGDGYWLEEHLSMIHDKRTCEVAISSPGYTGPPQLKTSLHCPHKPKEEFCVERPTSAINRFKLLFGTQFSYWGGWIDFEYSLLPGNNIRCKFDQYDLTDIKVLFLGGFPAGVCLQTETDARTNLHNLKHWDELPAEIIDSVNKNFESNTLEPLKRWLNQGGRVLVIDGGVFPEKFLSTLGLQSTVELFADYGPYQIVPVGTITPNTLNGSLLSQPIWGAELPDWTSSQYHDVSFEALHCDPVGTHPFILTVDPSVAPSVTLALDYLLVPDYTFEGSNIAGHPIGHPGATRGLINISQKYSYDTNVFDGANIPTGGLRSYTTAIPLVTPGPDAIILGRVRGELPIAPWFNTSTNTYVTTTVDYPAIVVEHWKASFKLRFTHLGVSAETGFILFTATAIDIKNALEALPNIGPSITVAGGPLPTSIDVWFDSPLVQGQDVTQLEVVSSMVVKTSTVREGGVGIDEIQRIEKWIGPSRVIVSGVNELVEPDQWGVNWGKLGNAVGPGSPSQEADNVAFTVLGNAMVNNDFSCKKFPLDYYGKDGYGWGLGLSNVASAKFLKNLLEKREEY